MFYLQSFIYAYALLVLVFVLFMLTTVGNSKNIGVRYFKYAAYANAILLLAEGLTHLPYNQSSAFAIAFQWVVLTCIFALNTVPMFLLMVYFDYRIFGESTIVQKRKKVYLWFFIPFFLSALMNIPTKWMFNVSQGVGYTRGAGLGTILLIAVFILLLYVLMTYRHIKMANSQMVSVFLMLCAMPVVGAMIQMRFVGVPGLWTLFALLILFVYMLVEREEMMRDTLTGLSTRGQFEVKLRQKIKSKAPFTLLMCDMDVFKMINDTYGHDEGDRALEIVSSILKKSVKRSDFVSRFGGDEFILLIEDSNRQTGGLIKERILSELEQFNHKHIKPYTIQMSIGYEFFDNEGNIDEIECLKRVDYKMYASKAR